MNTATVSITKKGQMTLPREIQKILNLRPPTKVTLEFNEQTKTLHIEAVPDILKFGAKFRAPKNKTALKARAHMEKNYER